MIGKVHAVGMIEFNGIAAGIEAADRMFKAAAVEPLILKTICPGKLVAAVYSETAQVKAAIDAGIAAGKGTVVDYFMIPNIDHAVISAITRSIEHVRGAAVGVIETFSAASAVEAADAAVKSADVDLIEVRLAMGLGGKGLCILSGDVGSVEAAVASAALNAAAKGLLVNKVVIPGISPEVLRHLI